MSTLLHRASRSPELRVSINPHPEIRNASEAQYHLAPTPAHLQYISIAPYLYTSTTACLQHAFSAHTFIAPRLRTFIMSLDLQNSQPSSLLVLKHLCPQASTSSNLHVLKPPRPQARSAPHRAPCLHTSKFHICTLTVRLRHVFNIPPETRVLYLFASTCQIPSTPPDANHVNCCVYSTPQDHIFTSTRAFSNPYLYASTSIRR